VTLFWMWSFQTNVKSINRKYTKTTEREGSL
jgi:hypothetical protein